MLSSKILNFALAALLLLLFFLFLRLLAADVLLTHTLRNRYYQASDATYRALQKAVTLNPREPLYHRELALFLTEWAQEELKTGSPAAFQRGQALAAAAYREAVIAQQLNPANSLTYKALLKTEYELARSFPAYAPAVEELGEALLRLSPTEAHIRYSVALVYAGHGKKERALQLTTEALQLKPDYTEAQQLKELLSKMDGTEE
jgi:tetratricopeptide (TPR) repeat protein